MGTRGFLTFVVDGREATTYNHCDSYPEGLGSDVLGWARDNQHELVCDDHGSVPGSAFDLVRQLRVVAPDSKPTPEDIERLRGYADLGVGEQRLDDWYVLLRETQGDPAAILKAGVLIDASEFPNDSLFAEWGYVIDVDARTFEVYQGFQHARHDKGRFADRSPRASVSGDYYPVALVASWPLDGLPSDEEFFAALYPDDKKDED